MIKLYMCLNTSDFKRFFHLNLCLSVSQDCQRDKRQKYYGISIFFYKSKTDTPFGMISDNINDKNYSSWEKTSMMNQCFLYSWDHFLNNILGVKLFKPLSVGHRSQFLFYFNICFLNQIWMHFSILFICYDMHGLVWYQPWVLSPT